LSGSADAFHKLSAAQASFAAAVTSGPGGGVLGRIQAAAVQPGRGRVRVEALPAPLGEWLLGCRGWGGGEGLGGVSSLQLG
jgi:hypothetical protein